MLLLRPPRPLRPHLVLARRLRWRAGLDGDERQLHAVATRIAPAAPSPAGDGNARRRAKLDPTHRAPFVRRPVGWRAPQGRRKMCDERSGRVGRLAQRIHRECRHHRTCTCRLHVHNDCAHFRACSDRSILSAASHHNVHRTGESGDRPTRHPWWRAWKGRWTSRPLVGSRLWRPAPISPVLDARRTGTVAGPDRLGRISRPRHLHSSPRPHGLGGAIRSETHSGIGTPAGLVDSSNVTPQVSTVEGASGSQKITAGVAMARDSES